MDEWAGEPCETPTAPLAQIVLLLSGQNPLAAATPSAPGEPRAPGDSPLAFSSHSGWGWHFCGNQVAASHWELDTGSGITLDELLRLSGPLPCRKSDFGALLQLLSTLRHQRGSWDLLSHGDAGWSDTSTEGALCSLQRPWEMDLWEWEMFLCLTLPTWAGDDEFPSACLPSGCVKLSRRAASLCAAGASLQQHLLVLGALST